MLEDAESRPTSWARDEGFDKAYDEAHDEGVHCVRSLITSGPPALRVSLSPFPRVPPSVSPYYNPAAARRRGWVRSSRTASINGLRVITTYAIV